LPISPVEVCYLTGDRQAKSIPGLGFVDAMASFHDLTVYDRTHDQRHAEIAL
jgi:hypothetical protein